MDRPTDSHSIAPGTNVLVVGGGVEGTSAARYLAERGARVTLSDRNPQSLRQDGLANVSVLPESEEVTDNVQLVVVSPGVPESNPVLQSAHAKGIPVTNATQIFLERCPCPVVGITGTSGKSTTTAMIAGIMTAAGKHACLGGNIGTPMLNVLDNLTPNSIAVIEMSSFQLQLVSLSPHVSVVTNISPNHLDRHGDLAGYIAAKANILTHQKVGDYAVLNRRESQVREMAPLTAATTLWFGEEGSSSFEKDGVIWLVSDGEARGIARISHLQVPGSHNVLNGLAATAACAALGASDGAIRTGLRSFTGLPHRLELVTSVNGVTYIDDSIATSPERAAVGVNAIKAPIILLAGGRSKGLPWTPLFSAMEGKVRQLIVYGEAAEEIEDAAGHQCNPDDLLPITRVLDLEQAVYTAQDRAEKGDTVLLSPACTSYDQFTNFEERGNTFKTLVGESRWQQ